MEASRGDPRLVAREALQDVPDDVPGSLAQPGPRPVEQPDVQDLLRDTDRWPGLAVDDRRDARELRLEAAEVDDDREPHGAAARARHEEARPHRRGRRELELVVPAQPPWRWREHGRAMRGEPQRLERALRGPTEIARGGPDRV